MPSQVIPFNEYRFDQCMLWMTSTHDKGVTQYEAVKLHILADFFHILECGRPVIGGALEVWPEGPVVKNAYNRQRARAHWFTEGRDTAPFDVEWIGDTVYQFRARRGVAIDKDGFGESETDAMERAWKFLMEEHTTWAERKRIFHDRTEYWGKAWSEADSRGQRSLDWNDVIDAFDQAKNLDHSQVKALIALGA